MIRLIEVAAQWDPFALAAGFFHVNLDITTKEQIVLNALKKLGSILVESKLALIVQWEAFVMEHHLLVVWKDGPRLHHHVFKILQKAP